MVNPIKKIENLIISLELHVLYMGKRKPKLCRMKRLVVSQNHIFLFTEDEPIYSLPFSFHFPFD